MVALRSKVVIAALCACLAINLLRFRHQGALQAALLGDGSQQVKESRHENDYDDDADVTPVTVLARDPNATSFCIPWDSNFDMDEGWTHHYEWEEDFDASTAAHSCFSKITNPQRVEFYRNVHHVQWHGNCSLLQQKYIINSGYGASFGTVLKAFASTMGRFHFARPFQMTRHWDGALWLYSTANNSSWAYCKSRDMQCFILPLTNCTPKYIDPTLKKNDRYREDAFPPHPWINGPQGRWLRQYMNRYRTVVRHKLWHTLHDEYPAVTLPCTTMHVRRGDAGLPRFPFRRYAAVSEYLEVGHVQPGDNIVLLT